MGAVPFVVALTGGIGSGKSTAASMFAARGAALVDADAAARSLTAAGGRAVAAVVAAFGEGVLDASGAMDRMLMRTLAFNDPAARGRLEAILHPLVREEVDLGLARGAAAGAPYALLDVPLYFETMGYRGRPGRVLAVDCSRATQLARVTARSGLAGDEIARIIAAQVPRAVRLQLADDVISNEGGLDALAAQVDRLHARYAGVTGAGARR